MTREKTVERYKLQMLGMDDKEKRRIITLATNKVYLFPTDIEELRKFAFGSNV